MRCPVSRLERNDQKISGVPVDRTDYVIVVAGGQGHRMGTDIPKQFLPLGDTTVLMRTLSRFHEALPDVVPVLVLPAASIAEWHSLCGKYGFALSHRVTAGGATRFESVRNGLKLIPDNAEGVVGVHDGVRPFVSVEVIRHCYQAAREGQSVVPALPSVESVRWRVGHDGRTEAADRSRCLLVQTPQTFPISTLKKAYAQPYNASFTDDASVVEADGGTISTVAGNRENIKLTTPFDLLIAKALLQS